MNASDPAATADEAPPWGLFFLMGTISLCIVACLVSWVICANMRSPTGDIVRDALLAVLRPQERARRRAMLAEVELAESAESLENSEDEAVLQRRTPPPPSPQTVTEPPPAPTAAPPPSAKALGKRRADAVGDAQESVFLGPTVYGC